MCGCERSTCSAGTGAQTSARTVIDTSMMKIWSANSAMLDGGIPPTVVTRLRVW